MRPIVTLTTDFGLRDGFVGAMKGVLLSRCRDIEIVDICHDVPPQNILAGALRLAAAAPYFPEGTVHVAVVDPGVGSDRRALAIAARGQRFVGPDNGLLSLAAADETRQIVEITNPAYWLDRPSTTFHGRDIFSPVAAHLACGGSIEDLGSRVGAIIDLAVPLPERNGREIVGTVIDVDGFGNLVTNVRLADLGPGNQLTVRIGGEAIDRISAFYDPSQRLVAVVNSDGWLEIAAPGASANLMLAAAVGTRVVLETRRPDETVC